MQRRYYYITPTSYLILLDTFKSLIQQKWDETLQMVGRYGEGLSKLEKTEDEVANMQVKLEDLQPLLVQKNQQMEVLLENLQEKQTEVMRCKLG